MTETSGLNEMWTCGAPVMIVNFFFSNQKFALYTGLLSPKGFRIKYSADADRDSADSTDSLGYLSAKLSSELYLAEYVKYIIYNICTICNI